jgi:YfiH family protein
VLYGTETPAEFLQKGDGMVSFAQDAYPAVTVADCLPVFLLDTEQGFFAVLHSGWKGTGIVLRALALMKEAGTRPEAAAAVLGPCIQSCCYRVDRERARNFQAEFGETAGSFFPEPVSLYREGAAYLDLQAANIRLLAAAGVRHIARCTGCTCTDERLGSYRREGPAAYTRMIAMAGLL